MRTRLTTEARGDGLILRILRRAPVRKQDELVRLLREAGHEATQSSISRDLRELGVLKAGGRYLPPSEDDTRTLDDFDTLRQFVRGVATAGDALTVRVWRTSAGEAVFTTSVGDRTVIDQGLVRYR